MSGSHHQGRREAGERDDLPRPLTQAELVRSIKPREALETREAALEMQVLFAGSPGAKVHAQLVRSEGARAQRGAETFAAELRVDGVRLGARVLPPSIPTVAMKRERTPSREAIHGFEGHAPRHLPLRVAPEPLAPELRAPYRLNAQRRPLSRDVHEVTTVFPPENRAVFNDTSYPWSTCGKVQTSLGQASGVLVGPRHLLTVSHVVQWNADNTAGWVKFTPAAFDTSAPFGAAWGTRVYYERKVTGPTIDRDEGQHDYVCVVLDRRIGEAAGWMGTRSWSDSWDDEPYWCHVGYPADISGGNRPTFQSSIPLDGSFWDDEVHTRIWHRADVFPGQSGGPYFAWWANETFPRVVAVQSGQNPDENSASGGAHMVQRVISARNDWP